MGVATCHAVGLAGDLVCPLVVIPAADEVWLGTDNQSTEGIILAFLGGRLSPVHTTEGDNSHFGNLGEILGGFN